MTDAETVARLLAEGDLLPASQAAKLIPNTRGRRRHTTTLVRWMVEGKRGVRLEGFHGPDGAWFTTRGALARFFAALTASHCAGRGMTGAPADGGVAETRARERLERARGRREELRPGKRRVSS